MQETHPNQHHAPVHNHTPLHIVQEEKSSILAPIIITILVVSIIALSGGVFYMYAKYTNLQKKMANPTVLADEELAQTINSVSKLIELPQGEKPILATVSDREKLSGQLFFEKAQVGDKVLLYVAAKKGVLYRPSSNKVINVASISVNTTPTAGAEEEPQAVEPETVEDLGSPQPTQ